MNTKEDADEYQVSVSCGIREGKFDNNIIFRHTYIFFSRGSTVSCFVFFENTKHNTVNPLKNVSFVSVA